jgi:hypothetical protein
VLVISSDGQVVLMMNLLLNLLLLLLSLLQLLLLFLGDPVFELTVFLDPSHRVMLQRNKVESLKGCVSKSENKSSRPFYEQRHFPHLPRLTWK